MEDRLKQDGTIQANGKSKDKTVSNNRKVIGLFFYIAK